MQPLRYSINVTLDGCCVHRAIHADEDIHRHAAENIDRADAQELKRKPGRGLLTGGLKLPMALAELGLIDEHEFVVQPSVVGHGPTLFAGLSRRLDLTLTDRVEFGSGAVAMRYQPRT